MRDPTSRVPLVEQDQPAEPGQPAEEILRPGQRAIDGGCGPSGILDLLAPAASPGGRVVGLDADPSPTALARQAVRGHLADPCTRVMPHLLVVAWGRQPAR